MALGRAEVEELYRRHGSAVLRRTRALLGNEALAQEAMHEVFVRALRKGDSFRHEASPTTWLHKVTTAYCLNQLRDQKLHGEKLQHIQPCASEPARAEALTLLRQVLAESDEIEASAAVFAYVDGMTFDEIAPLLRVSRRTVGNLLDRFCARARQRMDLEPAKGVSHG